MPGRKRRIAGWVTAIAGLVLVAAVLMLANSSLSLNIERAKADLEQRLAQLTGLPVTVDGAASFELLPRPLIRLSNLRLGEAGDDRVVTVANVIAQLDLLDALFGRTDIARLTLIRPEFRADDHDVEPWAAAGSTQLPAPASAGAAPTGAETIDLASAYLRSFLERFAGVRRIEVRDGVFRPSRDDAGFSNINVDFEWPGPNQSATLAGTFVWNGQPTEIDASAESPKAFLAGQASPVSVSLRAPPLSLRFSGTGAAGSPPTLDGRLRLETASVGRLSRWIGGSATVLPDFGPLTLDTELRLAGQRAFLGGVTLGLDDMTGQGAIELAFPDGGHPSLSGTLAFGQFDFDTLGMAIAPLPRNVLDLQRRIPLRFVQDFDLDLRLSAGQTRIAGMAMEDLAATVKFAAGMAILDIGDATMMGGRGQARFSMDANAQVPALQGTLSLQGVDAAQIAARLSAQDLALTGTTSITAKLDMPVGSWGQIIRQNRLSAAIAITSGTVGGLPAVADMTNADASGPLAPSAQPTQFEKLVADVSTSGSFLQLGQMGVDTADGRYAVRGLVSMSDMAVSLDGDWLPRASEIASEGDAPFTSSKPLEFMMRGEWPDLRIDVAQRSKPM